MTGRPLYWLLWADGQCERHNTRGAMRTARILHKLAGRRVTVRAVGGA